MADLFNTHPWLGTDGYKVCVAIAAASLDEMIRRTEKALQENRFLELRLDALAEPLTGVKALGTLLLQDPGARLIATCRRTAAGGAFSGSLEQELAVLEAAACAGCAIVDLALESAEAMRLEQHRLFREALQEAGAALLISYHDYDDTRDLALTMSRLMRHRPDLVKLVSTAKRLGDNLPILHLLSQKHSYPVVAIAMGEAGILSRVLGPRSGGLFTFGASDMGAETAPGQVAASTLRDLYRVDGTDQISPATRVYGVAGKPIGHSLSPLLHNTGFRSAGIDAVFLPLATGEASDLVHVARELPLHGLSITMPLKQAILPLLDHVDALAARVGACNTVVRQANGELHGYNTDVAGVCAPLMQRLGSVKGAKVLVLGAGGAARAAVFGLCDQGADVWILNRTPSTAAALASAAGARVAEPSMLQPMLHSMLQRSGQTGAAFDVLLNATPDGMQAPSGERDPQLAGPLLDPSHPLPARLIFDMVYKPLETSLIQSARAQGLGVITGAEMFVHQGARQFELWTGQAAPEAEMLRIVLAALQSAVP